MGAELAPRPEVKLPTLSELSGDIEKAVQEDKLKLLLNQQPPEAWVKVNKFAKDSKYLPIDKVEMMLDRIFQFWKVEILKTGQLFNGIEVTVRLHYRSPMDREWYYVDGVGAKELQTKKDTGVLKPDFSNVNPGAVEIALPIAKTQAIKDACHHLGKLFGRDLNRKETIAFTGSYVVPEEQIDFKDIEHQLSLITDEAGLQKYFDQLPEYHSNKKFQEMFHQKAKSFHGNN